MAPKKKPSAQSKKSTGAPIADENTNPTPDEIIVSSPSGEVTSDTKEEHVLLQLHIPDMQLDGLLSDVDMTGILHYDPNIKDPVPYTPANYFSNNADTLEVGKTERLSCTHDKLQANQVAEGTTIEGKQKICFWCCHAVGHMTYGMPIRYDFLTRSFTMYGTFCSLESAAAHNFAVHLGSDRSWEIHSWIQMLGRRFGYKEPIRPAPSRYLLKMFDGPLTIEEFRNAHKGQVKTYVLNIPPLINVTSQVEVVNTSFLGNTDTKHVTDKHVRKIAAKQNTLDAKMNLMIKEEETI
jgi:hypothetical protein